jgi:mttA/Hcf106 family
MLAEIFGLDGAVVAVIAVAVLFGAKRLPELARSVGRAQGEVSARPSWPLVAEASRR